MAVSVKCNSVVQANGRVYFRWSDGEELEFTALADVIDFVQELESGDNAKKLLMALAVRKNATNAQRIAWITGKTITLDLAAQDPIKVV